MRQEKGHFGRHIWKQKEGESPLLVGKRVLPAVASGLIIAPILFSQDTGGRLYPWGNP